MKKVFKRKTLTMKPDRFTLQELQSLSNLSHKEFTDLLAHSIEIAKRHIIKTMGDSFYD